MGIFLTILMVVGFLSIFYGYINYIHTSTKVESKLPISISNEKKSKTDLLTHYCTILKMDPSIRITSDLVEKHYIKRFRELGDSNISDELLTIESIELHAARKYLHDWISYIAHIN